MPESIEQQLFFMRRALKLAEKGRLTAPPNPWVGCLLINQGVVVGEGFHRKAGEAHAEVEALKGAGHLSEGATAYVTLEPCGHYGRTPPCTEALILAGIKRVVIPFLDPDPRVAGKGVKILRDAGIEVVVGVGQKEAEDFLEPYLHHRRTGRAFCYLKTAASIDGRIAAFDGSSQWITGEEAKQDVHRLRSESQAILVGSGTAKYDLPSLTVRYGFSGNQPLRVLIDGRGQTEARGPLFDNSLAPTLICTSKWCQKDRLQEWETARVEVQEFGSDENGHIDLKRVLEFLGKRGILQVLVEGGSNLQTSFVQSDLVDRLSVYYGGCLLGMNGKPLFMFPGPKSIQKAPRFELKDVVRLGNDVRLDYCKLF